MLVYDFNGNIFILIVTCPANKPSIICPINHCDHQTCSQYPDLKCIVDRCGQCKTKFIVNQDVTNQCQKLNHNIIENKMFKLFQMHVYLKERYLNQ